jgi:hypothetical protein
MGSRTIVKNLENNYIHIILSQLEVSGSAMPPALRISPSISRSVLLGKTQDRLTRLVPGHVLTLPQPLCIPQSEAKFGRLD